MRCGGRDPGREETSGRGGRRPEGRVDNECNVATLFGGGGGLAARALRLPPIVGYLAAGMIIGPFTPGYRAEAGALHELGHEFGLGDGRVRPREVGGWIFHQQLAAQGLLHALHVAARDRERQAGNAYALGIFVGNSFAGEINLNNVVRGAMQSATIGYWIDRSRAGNAYMSEAVVVMAKFAFEELRLHRIEICIIPRNTNSLRVVEKIGLRNEGLAERFLEINGEWEDHLQFAVVAEDWAVRGPQLLRGWVL